MSDQPDNPLELFTIDELATEIGRRSQSATVICTLARRDNRPESRPETVLYQYGSLAENVGQCEYAKESFMSGLMNGLVDVHPEEDADDE